jgi:hypothetical protein
MSTCIFKIPNGFRHGNAFRMVAKREQILSILIKHAFLNK